MMRERDPFLDRLRTLATVWVLMVHIFYWLRFFPEGILETVKSWLLLEMPLFFFLTGAGLSLSQEKPWGIFVCRSLRRMLIPYWSYALLCVVITAFHNGALNKSLLLYWIFPLDSQAVGVPFLTDALWYVPVYLFCIPFIPQLRRVKSRPLPVVALLVTMLLFFERQGWYYPQNVTFYSLWIYLGLHYPSWKKRYLDSAGKRWEMLLTAAVGFGLVVVLCVFGGQTWDMQQNKFPPNGVFLFFSVGGMSLLTLLLPTIVKVMNRLGRIRALHWAMDRLGRYSLSVFLYQSLAFLLLQQLLIWAAQTAIPVTLQFVCSCVLIVPLCVILTTVFGPLENLGRRKRS